jgi:hypothetical protein
MAKQVALITEGGSDFEDRLLQSLPHVEHTDDSFRGWDNIEYLPYLALAGASIAHEPFEVGTAVALRVTVPEEREEEFYANVERLISSTPKR